VRGARFASAPGLAVRWASMRDYLAWKPLASTTSPKPQEPSGGIDKLNAEHVATVSVLVVVVSLDSAALPRLLVGVLEGYWVDRRLRMPPDLGYELRQAPRVIQKLVL
jgi:hypothetical protein